MDNIWQEIRRDGEHGAKLLVSTYGNRLLGAATLLCTSESDAEDLVFRTFDRAIRKIGTYEPTGDFFNWLYTILLNFYRMDLRRRGPDLQMVGLPQDLPETAHELPDLALDAVPTDDIRRAVHALSVPLRTVVVQYYYNDAPVEQIATTLGIPTGTVKSRLHAARLELAKKLKTTRRE